MNAKKLAAEKAVDFVENGMIVGLGTGTTAYWAIQKIAKRIQDEGLRIQAVASSKNTEELAIGLGIPIVSFAKIDSIDLTIDGADEVDHDLNLIKGGGGALLREKILASHSTKFIVIIDESKLVRTLGKFPLPIEIVPFAVELTLKKLKSLKCKPTLRKTEGKEFLTDNGNLIMDCDFEEILNPEDLSKQIKMIPGVVEHGLFIRMTDTVIIGTSDGTTRFL